MPCRASNPSGLNLPIVNSVPASFRLMFSVRRMVHSFAYFAATLAAIAVFVFVLILAESVVYTLTGHPVSVWAMGIAAISAAFGYAPLVQAMQRRLDRLFFRHQLDTLAAIRDLGAGDLSELPIQNIELALLERICNVCRRRYAALDERLLPDGQWSAYPANAPPVPIDEDEYPKSHPAYELCLKLPRGRGKAYLWLGPRIDGWPLDPEERASLGSLAKFSAMSLEHARLTHQQAEAARLDSLSRIIQQLHSHDLKNRLHDLSFLAHHLSSGKLEKDDLDRIVTAIGKVTGRMQTLMRRVTDPNVPVDPVIKPLDLPAMLAASIRDRLWPEAVQVEQEFESLPPVAGDADLLLGVFENFYDNASQAMQGQGTIHVSASLVRDEQGEEFVEARVRDGGCGIDPEFIEQHLFQLFGTSKSNGLGVGLYLSRRIILAHGGDIAAQSEGAGKGSTFIVRLPLWQDEADSKQKGAEV